MSIDQFKISTRQAVYQQGNSQDHCQLFDTTGRTTLNSRPLGIIRRNRKSKKPEVEKDIATKDREGQPNDLRYQFYNLNDDMPDDLYMTGRANHAPRRNSSANPFHRSKTQVFENRYKIALSRSNTMESTKKQNVNRTIQLPMFKINIQTPNERSDYQRDVLSARNSLKEILENVKVKPEEQSSESTPRSNDTTSSSKLNFQKFQFLKPGYDVNNKTKLLSKRNIKLFPRKREPRSARKRGQNTTSPIRIPMAPRDKSESPEQRRQSVCESTDTDRMDIRIDSVDLKLWTDATCSDKSNSPRTLKLDNSASRVSQNSPISPTGSRSPYRYNPPLETPKLDMNEPLSTMVWPKYHEDSRPWRQDAIYQHHFESSSSVPANSANPSVRKTQPLIYNYRRIAPSPNKAYRRLPWNKDKTAPATPVLRYTSDKEPTEPIVVPSHSATMCPMCNIYLNRNKETSSCPPNSPSVNSSRGTTPYYCSEHINQTRSSSAGGDVKEREDNVDLEDIESQPRATNSAGTSRQGLVLTLPKVSVKMLDTREKFNDAKSSNGHSRK